MPLSALSELLGKFPKEGLTKPLFRAIMKVQKEKGIDTMKCENCAKWYEPRKKGSPDPCKDCPLIKGLKKKKKA